MQAPCPQSSASSEWRKHSYIYYVFEFLLNSANIRYMFKDFLKNPLDGLRYKASCFSYSILNF